MDLKQLADFARRVYPKGDYPKPIDALVTLDDVKNRRIALAGLKAHLRKRVEALRTKANPVQTAFDVVDIAKLSVKAQQRARKGELMLGQLLLGTLAEQAFEEIYRQRLGSTEFRLDDYRGSRNDTDYRVLNGGGRPLFRINSKLHGARFRQASQHVGLVPEDCFPLATYKIWSAREKEKDEHLPYLFLVISTPMTAEGVLPELPDVAKRLVRLVHASEVAEGKRDLEERIVGLLLREPDTLASTIHRWRSQLESAQWRVLSARRAEKLLTERLFERVFAIRTRNFNQAFRNAEIDMHFSLASDMTSLDEVLAIMSREGSQGIVGRSMSAAI